MAKGQTMQYLKLLVLFLCSFTVSFLIFALTSGLADDLDIVSRFTQYVPGKQEPQQYVHAKTDAQQSIKNVYKFPPARIGNGDDDDDDDEGSLKSMTLNNSIAIGLGQSTRKMEIDLHNPRDSQVKNMPFLKDLLPSFCRTYDEKFTYTFYIGYDYNDPFLSVDSHLKNFARCYNEIYRDNCKKLPVPGLTLVKVNYDKKPVWAQNAAMLQAYLDHNEYYYRINDDTIFSTPNWQSRFITTLAHYDPPNIGVVGPSFKFGNTAILTYDFVHRSHVDLFGFYYPHVFEGWHGDRWMTDVYKPGRSLKDKDIWIMHVESMGQRYPSHTLEGQIVRSVIKDGQDQINRYISQTKLNDKSPVQPQPSRIISFGLSALNDTAFLHGLLRNVVLAKLYFPGWTPRLTLFQNTTLPAPYARKLQLEGLQIKYIDRKEANNVPAEALRLLVVADPSVEYFLIRDVKSRIGARDLATVQEWETSRKGVHCVFDNPPVNTTFINPSHWGGNRKVVLDLLKQKSIADIFADVCSPQSTSCTEKQVFERMFQLDSIKTQVYCHSTVLCPTIDYIHGIGRDREHWEFIGQQFDENEIAQSAFPEDFSLKC